MLSLSIIDIGKERRTKVYSQSYYSAIAITLYRSIDDVSHSWKFIIVIKKKNKGEIDQNQLNHNIDYRGNVHYNFCADKLTFFTSLLMENKNMKNDVTIVEMSVKRV